MFCTVEQQTPWLHLSYIIDALFEKKCIPVGIRIARDPTAPNSQVSYNNKTGYNIIIFII